MKSASVAEVYITKISYGLFLQNIYQTLMFTKHIIAMNLSNH